MEIFQVEEKDIHVLRIEGIIGFADLDTFEEAVNTLIVSGHKSFLIDFKNVDYIDSSAIGMLVSLNKQARTSGISMRFRGVRENVLRILRITGVDAVLDFVESEQLGLCRDCNHYVSLGEAYGNCCCSQISGYDLVVQADSGCDSFEAKTNNS